MMRSMGIGNDNNNRTSNKQRNIRSNLDAELYTIQDDEILS